MTETGRSAARRNNNEEATKERRRSKAKRAEKGDRRGEKVVDKGQGGGTAVRRKE